MRHPVVDLHPQTEALSVWVLTIVLLILSIGTFFLLWLKANQSL